MEINFNHKELDNLAYYIVDNHTEIFDSGYILIDYKNLKPSAKTSLWISQAKEEEIESLSDDMTLTDLYFDLEDKNAFFVDKKDLPKYKYYMEQIDNYVKNIEGRNRALAENSVISIATNLAELGGFMSALDTDKIQENTVEILKGMLNQ